MRLIGILTAVAALLVTGMTPASADVDPWTLGGDVLNGTLVGPRSCSRTGGISAGSTQVTATGSVSCGRSYDAMEITVCVQIKQAAAPEGTSWHDYSCAPTKTVTGGGSASSSASGRCLPGPWAYRGVITAAGYRNGETPWTGLFVTEAITPNCPF
jgi:hypothetical protein